MTWNEAKKMLSRTEFPYLHSSIIQYGSLQETDQSRWHEAGTRMHITQKSNKHSTVVYRRREYISGFEVDWHAVFCPACAEFKKKTAVMYNGETGMAYFEKYL